MTYERVKKNWENGLFDLNALKRAYAVGIITKEEYRYIKTLPQAGTSGPTPDEVEERQLIEAAKILMGVSE